MGTSQSETGFPSRSELTFYGYILRWGVKATATVKRGEKTRLQNMVRNAFGRYYARLFLNGKEIWKTLKTSHFSVAEAKLAEVLKKYRKGRAKQVDPSNAKMTFGGATKLHMQRVDENVALKRRTKKDWKEIKTALFKSWPELERQRFANSRLPVAGDGHPVTRRPPAPPGCMLFWIDPQGGEELESFDAIDATLSEFNPRGYGRVALTRPGAEGSMVTFNGLVLRRREWHPRTI